MIIWLDAQLPPQLATWIRSKFLIDATAIRDLAILICETQKTAQYSQPLAKQTQRCRMGGAAFSRYPSAARTDDGYRKKRSTDPTIMTPQAAGK